MPEAVQIGVIAERVVARTLTMMAFQQLLSSCPTTQNRRAFLASAYANGALTETEHRALAQDL